MSDSLTKWNVNYVKCFLLFFEPGTETIVQTLRWLYVGPTRIEDHLVDLVRKWPRKFHSIELKALECLKGGEIAILELGLPFLLKISLLLCGLDPDKELPVWTQFFQPAYRDEMKCHLLKLQNGHRNLRTLRKRDENISDSFVLSKCEEMKGLLTSLLQKAGGNNRDMEINYIISKIMSDVDRVCRSEECAFPNKNYSRFVILNDFEDLLASSLGDELQVYSIQDLTLQENRETSIPLEDILADINTRAIVVLGEPGIGKTSLTKFLFNSWKCDGLSSSIKSLSNYDASFRVECRKIKNKEMTRFFQDYFPFSTFLLSNTSKLMKFLDDLKILWIMDSYDECTAECKSFMTTLIKRLPEGHKVLVTSRPNKQDALKTSLSGLSQLTLFIDLLNERNVDDITKHYVTEKNMWKSFKEEIDSLDNTGKLCLKVPLNLSLYTELWLHDSFQMKEPFSALTLYRKSTYLSLQKLIEKESSTDGVERKLQRWFYESLCKESFLSVMRWDNVHNDKVLATLEEEARQADFVPLNIISAFLTEAKERDGKINYDFKYREQQYILASLFLRNLKKYNSLPMKEMLTNPQIYPALQLLKFYIEMAVDDDSINCNTKEIFWPISEVSLIFKQREQKYIWCSTSVTSKFNEHYMEEVAKSMTRSDLEHLDTCIFESFLETAQFLKYAHPKKIRITNSNTFEPEEREEFLTLLDVLKELQPEIHLHTNFSELNDTKGTSEIDTINETSLRITSFTGTMTEFQFLGNHHSSLETLELMIHSEEEFLQLCEALFQCDSLKDIQLYIVFDSFSSSIPVSQFPEELLAYTTVSFRRLTMDNFDNFIFFLSEIKGDEALKIKALFHCFDQISESQKQLLDEVASLVVFERCPYSKSLSKEAEFQIYSFPVEFHEVHSWKYCYQTYRNR